jgi:hypothetical protein
MMMIIIIMEYYIYITNNMRLGLSENRVSPPQIQMAIEI